MRLIVDFTDALMDYAQAIRIDPQDKDSMWYVADIFEAIISAALVPSNTYKEVIDGVVDKIAHETGESRAVSQSACDLAVTQILDKLDTILRQDMYVDFFKTNKIITRHNKTIYTISLEGLGYI